MTFQAEFESLLKQAMGLDAASIGSPSIERAVQERLSACELENAHAYLERVRSSETELQALIEAVVVAETWFFRDSGAFQALARFANEEWRQAHPNGVLRLLSLPCSTGEEPYSMAMALLDSGFPPSRFLVDAVDISAHALSRATRATYGRNSFRGKELAFRERHFETVTDGYRLNESVRRRVNFRRRNLFDPGFLPEAGIYDVVFCRNVLIYFDRSTQNRAVGVLERLLSPKGILFVGPSETGLLLNHAFVSSKVPLAFAFRRAPARISQEKPAPTRARIQPALRPRAPSSRYPKAQRSASTRPTGSTWKKTVPPVATRHSARPPAPLEEATRLADDGKLALATKLCEAHLEAYGPSAPAFYLLGVISGASGNANGAADYYRKALYLDPNHQDALFHLALFLDGQGDTAAAKTMRERAQRLADKRRK